MSTRTTGLGVVALVAGVITLMATDGMLPTALGTVALVAGAVVMLAAGLRGVGTHASPEDSLRAAAAEHHGEAESSAQLKRASETGRWPRVIGGG